jgi:putative transposase
VKAKEKSMRRPRKLRTDARYHVTARINRSKMELEPTCIKEMLLDVIVRAKEKYAFTLSAHSIMSNHIHLLIKPENGLDLPAIMQWTLSVFAMSYNRKLGLTGHVWQDRYRSFIIESVYHFFRAFFYIADSSVRAGIVERPADFRFSHAYEIVAGDYKISDPPDDQLYHSAVRYFLTSRPFLQNMVRKDVGFYNKKKSCRR